MTPTTLPAMAPADIPPSLLALLGGNVGVVEEVALDLVAAGMWLADGVAVVEVIF
jgi:hypothetical protein